MRAALHWLEPALPRVPTVSCPNPSLFGLCAFADKLDGITVSHMRALSCLSLCTQRNSSRRRGVYDKMPPVHALPLSGRRRPQEVCGQHGPVKVKQEEVIMRQGDKGNNFYLIEAGSCDVWVADGFGERKNVRSLTAGQWCGELSLPTNKQRSASILATSERSRS